MKKISLIISIALCLLLFNMLLAENGKISGFVFDKSTNHPIPNANVILVNSVKGAASQSGGYFFINDIPQGNYDVKVKVIGYENQTKTAVLVEKNTKLNFYLAPQPIQFDPIIVSASLSEHHQSQISVSSEILTSAKLQKQTGSTAGEALESIGGLYIKNYDGFAGVLSPSIRGSHTNQVVVLLDDMRLNTAQGGGVDLNSFPTAVLEKIEVVRGGHSAIVGSDALGGAIQLISKESIAARGFSYGLNSTVGSFGSRMFNIYGSHKIGLLSYFVNYNMTQSDGDFTFKTPGTGQKAIRENNDYKGNNLFLKTKLDLNDNNRIQLIYHDLDVKKGAAGSVNIDSWSGEPMLTPNARSKYDRRLLSLQSRNQIFDRLRFEELFYYHTYDYNYKDPDGWSPTDDLHENKTLGFNLKGFYHFNSYFNLVAGVELRQDKLKSTKFVVDDRNIQSLFAQSEIKHDFSGTQWSWIPAVRWDNYSDVNSFTSPKLGLLIATGENMEFALRGNVGQSFRAPAFDDLYWPDEGWGKGNPNLEPEISTNVDMGFVLRKKSFHFIQAEINYFINDVENLIAWGTEESGIWTPLNIGNAKIRGIETGIKFNQAQDLYSLSIFHTWMKATDETANSLSKGKRLIYRPDSKLDFAGGIMIGQINLNLNYRIVSKRYTSTDNKQTLPNYQLLNGNIGYRLKINGFSIDTKLDVLNMLDKSVYLNDGFPMPGREIRFTLGLNY
jgi:vitamin B12 transporter